MDNIYTIQEVKELSPQDSGEIEMLIKWVGFGEEENTWEPASNIM